MKKTTFYKELHVRCYDIPKPASGMLQRVLKFAQVLKLSKVAELKSPILLKLNYFTGRFKLFESPHLCHRVSYTII